jgi:hypothetical protein
MRQWAGAGRQSQRLAALFCFESAFLGLRALPTTSATTVRTCGPDAVTVGGGLDALVGQVALDYRQRDTALDEPRSIGTPDVMSLDRFVMPCPLPWFKAGTQTVARH